MQRRFGADFVQVFQTQRITLSYFIAEGGGVSGGGETVGEPPVRQWCATESKYDRLIEGSRLIHSGLRVQSPSRDKRF